MNFFAGILNLAEDFARPSKKDIDEIRRQQKLDNEQLLEHQNSHPSSGLE